MLTKIDGGSLMRSTVHIPRGYVPIGEHSDQLARFASMMLRLTSMTEERRRFGHFIDLNSNTMRKMFGGAQWHHVKREAIESGLIEENGSWQVGHHSIGYRLCRRFRDGKTEDYKLRRKPRSKKTSELFLTPTGVRLFERLRLVSLPNMKVNKPWLRYLLDRIAVGDYYASVCDFGRFHSNFTGLPKETRSQIYGSQPLSAIDIRNTQPLLIGALAHIHTTPHTPHIPHTPHTPHIPLCCTLFHFLDLCQRGEIYDWIQERLRTGEIPAFQVRSGRNSYWEDPQTWDRARVKKAFIICLFDRVSSTLTNPIYLLFERHFPPVAEFVIRSKQSEYQQLAHLCQRMESTLMIEGVARRFMDAFPDEPIVTIHDELIVPTSRIGHVMDLIRDEFALLGVVPNLAISSN